MVLRVLFYLLYPLVWLYSPLFVRARLLIVAEGNFVAVKGRFSNNNWHLPGGGKRTGEDLKIAVIREAREELGLILEPKDVSVLLPKQVFFNLGLIQRGAVFVVNLPKKQPLTINYELKAVEWLPLTHGAKGLGNITRQAVDRYNRS